MCFPPYIKVQVCHSQDLQRALYELKIIALALGMTSMFQTSEKREPFKGIAYYQRSYHTLKESPWTSPRTLGYSLLTDFARETGNYYIWVFCVPNNARISS